MERTSPLVALLDVDLSEITNTSDLNVVFSTNKVHALERAIRNDARASAALSAPSNFLPFSIADVANGRRGP